MRRWSVSQVLAPAVCLLLIGIFFVFLQSGLSGENGLGALARAEAEEARLERELAALAAEREALANRVRRLDESYLDLDLLDERARVMLGHAREDELIVR